MTFRKPIHVTKKATGSEIKKALGISKKDIDIAKSILRELKFI